MTKIHILCEIPRSMTGFSIVGKHLAEGLHDLGHDVSMTGFQTAYESEWYKGIEILPLQIQHIEELEQFIFNVRKVNPDIVICIFNSDNANQNMFAKAVSPTCFYTPIEGRNICSVAERDLKEISKRGKVIAQCNWGKNEMKKKGIDSQTIYHGYDPLIFRKLKTLDICTMNEKINIVKHVNGKWTEINSNIGILKKDIPTNKRFIFGFCGANHGIRKRIERLLKSYSLFLEDNQQLKDRTLLILKTMPVSVTSPVILPRICDQLEISSNVIFLYGENNKLTDTAINSIYNLFDVNVSASSSEGFGFPTLETMAIGIPQIGPNCSSFIELIGEGDNKRGLIAEKGEWVMIQDGSERFEVNEQCFADKMKEMFKDNELREKCGKNAMEWSKQYTWNKIIIQWDNLIKELKT